MRSRNAARMMQPARQIAATEPRSMPQSYASLPARIWWKPWVYETTFDAYSACSTRSANADASAPSSGSATGPGSSREASRRSAWPERERAKTASAIPETGTPRSSAICTVQRPVPFCSARSCTMSTNGLPVAASVWARTSAVISIRYESSRPVFQLRKVSAMCAGSTRPPCAAGRTPPR